MGWMACVVDEIRARMTRACKGPVMRNITASWGTGSWFQRACWFMVRPSTERGTAAAHGRTTGCQRPGLREYASSTQDSCLENHGFFSGSCSDPCWAQACFVST